MSVVCWKCETKNSFTEKAVNYCCNCGMMLRQKCPYCDGTILFDEKECSWCNGIFSFCSNIECKKILSLNAPKCDECNNKTSHNYRCFQPMQIDNERSNCYTIDKDIDYIFDNKDPLTLGNKISHLAICNSNLVFWKKHNSGCRLCCINSITMNSVWKNNTETEDISLENFKYIEICDSYILTYLKDRILINSLVNGKSISKINIKYEYKSIMYKSVLYVLLEELNMQYVLKYVSPFTDENSVKLEETTKKYHGNKIYSKALPISGNNSIFFVNYSGDIIRLTVTDTESISCDIVREYMNGTEIEYMALKDDKLIFTHKSSELARTISKINIANSNRNYISTNIAINLNLYFPKFSICGDSIYLCEDLNGSSRFSRYQIVDFSRGEYRTANSSFIDDFYVIKDNDVAKIIYKCKSNRSQAREIMRMSFDNEEYNSLKTVLPNSSIYIANINDKVLISELDKGTIYFT